jgi:hypothetical protein
MPGRTSSEKAADCANKEVSFCNQSVTFQLKQFGSGLVVGTIKQNSISCDITASALSRARRATGSRLSDQLGGEIGIWSWPAP